MVESIEKATTGDVKGTSSRTTTTSQTQVDAKYMKIPPPAFTIRLDALLKDLKKKLLVEDRSVLVLTAPGVCEKTILAKMLCQDNQIKSTYIFKFHMIQSHS